MRLTRAANSAPWNATGEAPPGEEDPGTWIAGGYRTTLRDTLADPANKESCVSADDWSEIARWIGADPEVLSATAQEHNGGYCDAGRDALWAKAPEHLVPLRKPPFYALRFRPLMIDTAGPLQIDQYLRVLDPQSRPIPGLFGVGSVVGGWIGLDEHPRSLPLPPICLTTPRATALCDLWGCLSPKVSQAAQLPWTRRDGRRGHVPQRPLRDGRPGTSVPRRWS